MRYRICDKTFINNMDKNRNDIYRKFAYQFSNLFNTGEIAKNNEEFEEMYIADCEFEERINLFLESINSTAQFCVGYTGIGKTTSIRHCLELGVKNIPNLSMKSKLTPGKRIVVFPTFLDGYEQPDGSQFDLPSRVSAVCTVLEEEHPELQEIYNTHDGLKQFYNFIKNNTPRILETGGDIWDLSGLSEKHHIINRLDSAMKNNPLEYYMCKLKYYLYKKYDTYDRLVIILDDVETMPENFQEQIVIEYLRLFTSMQNTDYPQDSNYRVSLLISLRPHTYRIISNGMRGRRLAAYSIEGPIIKRHSVDLDLLFKKRFDYYTSMLPSIVGNRESWVSCYEKLMLINQAFDGRYKDIISNLCFMNVRTSLAEYAKIFSNRFWIQKNQPKLETFNIGVSEFDINAITVVRAIGCGESRMFMGEDDSIIPNFFYTTCNEDYSIQCLLVMQYFGRKMYSLTGTGDMEYGSGAEELSKVYEEWRSVFDEEHIEQLSCALKHLFKCKVLRKSIMDFDDYQTLDTANSLNDASLLYISPRGVKLIDMLRSDSVLLEMLRECAWRDYSGRESDFFRECSYDLIRNGQQDELYIDLLEYVDMLRQAEEDFFFSQKDIDSFEYQKLFGPNLVVEYLLSGVENSLRYSGKIFNSNIGKKYYKVKDQIDESKMALFGRE